jgi:hypothetical protein
MKASLMTAVNGASESTSYYRHNCSRRGSLSIHVVKVAEEEDALQALGSEGRLWLA